MAKEDLQKKNDTDLKKYISETREELRTLRFNASGSGVRDGHKGKITRREVARALTELNARNNNAAEKNNA